MATPTETFISTLTQTPPLSAKLQGDLQRLKNDNAQIIKVLGYTKTLADNLDKLDDALTLTNNLLTIVSVIPEVGQAASALKNSIAVLSPQVSRARKAADSLEAKVKPLRDALGKLDSGLDKGIELTGRINSTSQSFLQKFTAVVSCVNSLPDGTYKQQAKQYLDQFSSAVEPSVAALNSAMSKVDQTINDFYSALSKIKDALNPLKAIADAVQRVLDVLSPIIGPLQALKDALESITIIVPIPYPHPVKLYDIFKFFGDLIGKAMALIQPLVDAVLKALHITLPSIPGLDQILNIHIDIPGIPDFSVLLPSISNPFDQFNLNIPKFSLKCPPSAGDTAPVWK